ncbi:MAG: tyrosine-type recombinase/integrase [Salipiger thiooxidans]|uniref:tyrosine-type recombinase/integrase n=1 Tax=Salipiger thiooxidans TaxID=282683 RepID=UPI0021F66402
MTAQDPDKPTSPSPGDTAQPLVPEDTPDTPLPSPSAGTASPDRRAGPATASDNTLAAYRTDWTDFTRWCRRHGLDPLSSAPCPAPEIVARYLASLAAGDDHTGKLSLAVSTIERRLSGLVWNYAQRGLELDRRDRQIASVLAGIRQQHARPPAQKTAIRAGEILAMAATLPHDLRGLRDRALLLLGYAGGLRRSEIVGLDRHRDDTPERTGWVEIMAEGALLTFDTRSGLREVEVGRGSSDRSCPVHALEQWLHFARIDSGPVFVATSRDGTQALGRRLNDRHVARLIKRTVLDAGIRSDLPEAERLALFSGQSLRAGLARFAEATERTLRTRMGHASADETRRDRFRVNLTTAAGL